jgi:PKD repeat protein
MKRLFLGLALAALSVYLVADARAGGPLATFRGRAVVYQSSKFPIPFNPDQGSLGSYSNSTASALVEDCFEVWQSVPTATITVQNAGQLPADINASNYSLYSDKFTDGLNPIIFDSDGAIIDDEFGAGMSDVVIGFAGSAYSTGTGYYLEGLAVLNGRFTAVFSEEEFKASFVHEFGHFLGLDHCQINAEYVADGNSNNDPYVPSMFPTSTDDDRTLASLNPDDEAALTMLYPAADVDEYYGWITGRVLRGDGSPVLGANVVAVKIGDEQLSRFSSVSDYYEQNDGSFQMLVTPGSYRLFIEPIDPAFTEGSSVGPYAEDASDASFVDPVTKEYYNGDGESSQESDLEENTQVSVSAGETADGIDFIAEGGGTAPSSTSTASPTTTTSSVPSGTSTTSSRPTTTSTVPQQFSVDFEGSPTAGQAPLTVVWQNLSTGDIASYEWDFGDGSTSAEKNTVHIYRQPGIYAVSLTAIALDGRLKKETKESYISVSASCPFEISVADQEQLAALRTVRRLMRATPAGSLAVYLYESTAAEAAAVLAGDEQLRLDLRDLTEENIAAVQQFIAHGTAALPVGSTSAVCAFLAELRLRGSLRLRVACDLACWGLESNALLEDMGIAVK